MIEFITANWASIGEAALAVVGAASLIAKLTPTPKDDEILTKVVKALDFLALNKERK